MSDLISRKEALEAITGAWGLDGCTTWICQTVIKGLPAAHPEPETGEWIEDEVQTYIEKMYHCSNCGFKAWGEFELTPYCGGCGSHMKVGNEYARI